MKRTFLLLIVFVSLSLSAQSVIVYDAYKADTKKSVAQSDINNNVQWNISLLTRGAFAITYERKISEFLGIEAGVGLTYMDPLTQLALIDTYVESSETYKGGFLLSGALKIYPKEMMDFEGVYASPVFRYRTYALNNIITDYYTDASSNYVEKTQEFQQNLRATDMALLIGYQYEGDSGILWNAYFGGGWTNKRYDDFSLNETSGEWQTEVIKVGFPNFFCGLSLGFTF